MEMSKSELVQYWEATPDSWEIVEGGLTLQRGQQFWFKEALIHVRGGTWGSVCDFQSPLRARVFFEGKEYFIFRDQKSQSLVCAPAEAEKRILKKITSVLGGTAVAIFVGLGAAKSGVATDQVVVLTAAVASLVTALLRQILDSFRPGTTWTAQAGG